MPKKKYYVVWQGRRTGIFTTWEECAAQVNGYPEAQYKAFDSLEQAQQALQADYSVQIASKPPDLPAQYSLEELHRIGKHVRESYSVDAACSGNPGVLEYRCVYNKNRRPVFHQGPYQDGTNNVGEFLAIVQALQLFQQKDIRAPLYSDSETAIKWVEAKKCKTKLERTGGNEPLFELIDRAEKWLRENTYENQVLKWQTEIWGEIPADFGRK